MDIVSSVNIMEIIGWIGSMMFAFCALPQCIMVCKQKHANGLSWAFLSMWAIGEILCFLYVLMQPIIQIPLLANYVINFVMLMVIIWYKVKGNNLTIDKDRLI
jgi:uncharacterized protein with PQ loop repeat